MVLQQFFGLLHSTSPSLQLFRNNSLHCPGDASQLSKIVVENGYHAMYTKAAHASGN